MTDPWITLPWPDKRLSPNARVDRRQVADVKRAYRQACHWATKAARFTHLDRDGLTLHLRITFYPPDDRARDLDNMLASIKAGLDGVSDGIGVDDSRWELTIRRGHKVKGGEVRIEFGAPTGSAFIPFRGQVS